MVVNNNQGADRELRQEQVNLKILPNTCKTCVSGQQLTIGDLHGNAMKLLYFLIAEGVLTLDDDPEQQQKLYQELYAIYETGMDHKAKNRITISRPSEDQLARFSTILDNAKITVGAKNAIVRLIGDDLVDRGGNDYLTMLVMHKIQANDNLSLRVVMSNHAAGGVEIYKMLASSKSYRNFQTKFKAKTNRDFMVDISGAGNLIMNAGLDFNHQCSSMHGLFSLLEDRDIEFKHVQALYASYEKSLSLIDYSINAEGQLLIYTHAPVDLADIKQLAVHYQVLKVDAEIPENTEFTVALIEAINTKFKERLVSGKIIADLEPKFDDQAAVYNFIWMRRSRHGHYHVPPNTMFVHGHDGVGESPAGMINLDDSQIGKFHIVEGELPVLIARNEFTNYAEYKQVQVANKIVASIESEKDFSSILSPNSSLSYGSPRGFERTLSDEFDDYDTLEVLITDTLNPVQVAEILSMLEEQYKSFNQLQADVKNEPAPQNVALSVVIEKIVILLSNTYRGIVDNQDLDGHVSKPKIINALKKIKKSATLAGKLPCVQQHIGAKNRFDELVDFVKCALHKVFPEVPWFQSAAKQHMSKLSRLADEKIEKIDADNRNPLKPE